MTGKRVLLVGGAGVFGSRLAQGLLATTDVHLIIAGRHLTRAEAAMKHLGAHQAASLDRITATASDIRALKPDLVIDAAGPFQGANLAFARAVINAGADYIDLADARDFVAAFRTLDAEARTNNVCAITGASSTPALTHAAVHHLTEGWARIDSIRTGISPGNRAPRGRTVIEAILGWTGRPVRVFEDGAWLTRPGWSGSVSRVVPGLGRRRFALADTPDLDLLPTSFAPREEAVFSAGLELGFLHHGLGVIGHMQRLGLDFRPLAGVLQGLASLLSPFGSDRGCMFVEALGRDAEDRPVRAQWTLIAPPVVGPFTPTLPALLMARRLLADRPAPHGARPCIGLLTLSDLADDFARVGLATRVTQERLTGLFERALGEDFERLPAAVRNAHRRGPIARFEGRATVAGATFLGAIPARLFGFPRKAVSAPVRVVKRLTADGEIWRREIGGASFQGEIRHAGPGRVTERFGPFTFTLALSASETALTMSIVGWRMGWLPLPRILAPRSIATETESPDGSFVFDVPISAPLAGRLTRYKGMLTEQQTQGRPT